MVRGSLPPLLLVGGGYQTTAPAHDAEVRYDRLEAWARERVPELDTFVTLLCVSDHEGSELIPSLEAMASSLNERRAARTIEAAEKGSVKILAPASRAGRRTALGSRNWTERRAGWIQVLRYRSVDVGGSRVLASRGVDGWRPRKDNGQ